MRNRYTDLEKANETIDLLTSDADSLRAALQSAKELSDNQASALKWAKEELQSAKDEAERARGELAETRAKRDEYDDGQAHWFNEHFKLRVERDALTAENEKLREALTMLHRWCTEDQLDLSREGITRATVLATVTAALHPATKEGKAE